IHTLFYFHAIIFAFFSLILPPPPCSPLFPYTTLFRSLGNAPLALDAHDHVVATGALIDVPAVLIIAAMTALLYVGVRGSASANTIMVALKVGIIVIIVIAGLKYIDPSNWRPYVPPNSGVRGHFGWTGVLQGAAIIFFSYVGFDTASTTALEARNPQRDLPLGIIGALV